jgi:hypothetical protein
MIKIEEKYKNQIVELENKSKQSELENVQLKENVVQLSKEKTSLEKKCTTVSSIRIKFCNMRLLESF